jgi:uncharacterized protein (TIGR02466 family)
MRWADEIKASHLEATHLRQIATLAREQVRVAPQRISSWLTLSDILRRLGVIDETIATLREAIAVLPAAVDLRLALAGDLRRQNLFEEAIAEIDKALSLEPEDERARLQKLDLLLLARTKPSHFEGADLATHALSNPRVMDRLTARAAPDEVLKLCEDWLARDPAHTYAKYLRAVALARLGRDEEARSAMELDRLVYVGELAAPPGYDDRTSFHAALEREIRANPTLRHDPRGKATRDGFQTEHLGLAGARACDALRAAIARAIDAFAARLEQTHDDFLQSCPEKAQLLSWAVICGGDGHQTAHCHPGGWVSGVYYVAAPRPKGENAYRGPLILGALDSKQYRFAPPWGTREIEPVPGRVVIFPSYVPHATASTGIEGARISVGFDCERAA